MVYFQSIASFPAQTQNRSPVYLHPEGKATGSTFKLSLNNINLSWLVDCWEGKRKKREAVASRLRVASPSEGGVAHFFSSRTWESWRCPSQKWSVWLGCSRVHQLCLHYTRCSPKQYCFILKFIGKSSSKKKKEVKLPGQNQLVTLVS